MKSPCSKIYTHVLIEQPPHHRCSRKNLNFSPPSIFASEHFLPPKSNESKIESCTHTEPRSDTINVQAIYIESKVPYNPISLSLNVLLVLLLCYIYWIYIQFVWELKTHRLLPMIVGIDGDEMCRQERVCKSVVENPSSREGGGRIILKYCILLTSFSLTLYLFIQTTSDHSRKNSMHTLCCSCQNGFACEFISIWKTLVSSSSWVLSFSTNSSCVCA